MPQLPHGGGTRRYSTGSTLVRTKNKTKQNKIQHFRELSPPPSLTPSANPSVAPSLTSLPSPTPFQNNIPDTLKNYSRSYGRVFTTLATKGVKEVREE